MGGWGQTGPDRRGGAGTGLDQRDGAGADQMGGGDGAEPDQMGGDRTGPDGGEARPERHPRSRGFSWTLFWHESAS